MFLDIGVGILSAILASALFRQDLTPAFLAAGIVFALLPDVDFVFHFASGGDFKNAHKHRDFLHYPLLYVPLGMALAVFLGPAYALLFGICSAAHFLHDSIGMGWGIQWLYPFSRNHYNFFYHYEPRGGEIPGKTVYVWKHKEVDGLAGRHGDPDWVKNVYLRFHPYAVIELAVFAASLIILYIYIAGF